jgi:hypothetical protein
VRRIDFRGIKPGAMVAFWESVQQPMWETLVAQTMERLEWKFRKPKKNTLLKNSEFNLECVCTCTC